MKPVGYGGMARLWTYTSYTLPLPWSGRTYPGGALDARTSGIWRRADTADRVGSQRTASGWRPRAAHAGRAECADTALPHAGAAAAAAARAVCVSP